MYKQTGFTVKFVFFFSHKTMNNLIKICGAEYVVFYILLSSTQ